MVNKVILLGNLGADPEFKTLENGNAIASFSVATTETWKDKEGNKQEATEWHRCVVFGKGAELIHKYVFKGSRLYIEGKLSTRKWQDKDGNDKYTTEVVVKDFKFLSKNESGAGAAPAASNDAPDDDLPF